MSRPNELLERRVQTGVEAKLDMLHDDVSDMKSVLKELTIAINRLAIVEERQTQTTGALERAFVALAAIEKRISDLEKQAVTTGQTSKWVGKAVWAACAALAALVAKKLGFV